MHSLNFKLHKIPLQQLKQQELKQKHLLLRIKKQDFRLKCKLLWLASRLKIHRWLGLQLRTRRRKLLRQLLRLKDSRKLLNLLVSLRRAKQQKMMLQELLQNKKLLRQMPPKLSHNNWHNKQKLPKFSLNRKLSRRNR